MTANFVTLQAAYECLIYRFPFNASLRTGRINSPSCRLPIHELRRVSSYTSQRLSIYKIHKLSIYKIRELSIYKFFNCGQALPLAVGLAALGALSLVVLYNVGQTVAAKIRLTHVADAAAYSGALVQARALNLLAYINRAQVAHQVAMAHLVTLATWVQFGQTERQRLLQWNPPAALIGLLFGPEHASAYTKSMAAQPSASILQDFMRAYAQHDEVVHRVLAGAAQATVENLPVSRQQAMQAVVQANYPEFAMPSIHSPDEHPNPLVHRSDNRLVMRIVEDSWPGFVQRYRDSHSRYGEGYPGEAFRSLILQAVQRYDFLAPRQGTMRNTWPVSWRCPLRRHELRRRGQTTLRTNGTWESTDTQSFHKLNSNTIIGCYYREYVMGWGNVAGSSRSNRPALHQVSGEVPRDFSKQDFWRWVRQHTRWDITHGTTNALASVYAAQAQLRWPGHGLPAYIEIPAQRTHHVARFVLSLQQPASLLATTDAHSTVATPLGRFFYQGLKPHEKVAVTSAAEVYFARPDRHSDGKIELPTLFRPYWHARLTAGPAVSSLPELK